MKWNEAFSSILVIRIILFLFSNGLPYARYNQHASYLSLAFMLLSHDDLPNPDNQANKLGRKNTQNLN